MSELRPYPFESLVRRALLELEQERKLFDLPLAKGYFGHPELDFSAKLHGRRVASPLGPAAGPHTQMAQNIALSWMAGCRVMELKTVQVNDRLEIPRPCIDMQTVGYNIEWSQELRIQESLEEYVKAWMLIEILKASELIPLEEGFGDTVFDLSLGYDLAGIRTPQVQAFIDSMLDATELIDRFRKQIPAEFSRFRDLDFESCLSDQVTLSTFHGCPPDEIEGIAQHLLEEKGLHTVVKLNPTLLGPERVNEWLHDRLGYTEARVPRQAFEEDTHWEEMTAFCERLGALAERLELGFGVKFTNTLIVENHRDFFPASEERMYLSGPPLHVLAMNLVADFRSHFDTRFPISFSAGIDRHNFADALALGLLPVTTCSDLLKTGGYGRGRNYFQSLAQRMEQVGAKNLEEFSLRAYGAGIEALERVEGLSADEDTAGREAWAKGTPLREALGDSSFGALVSTAQRLNADSYLSELAQDERYTRAKNAKVPKKIGRQLVTFDCVACDKCVPVCPNGANFAFHPEAGAITVEILELENGNWARRREGEISIEQKAQYANFADFCNDCGNCDVFCPEDGGPYKIKPRFFGSLADWKSFSELDGFAVDRDTLHGRFDGVEYILEDTADGQRFKGSHFDVTFAADESVVASSSRADAAVDLTFLHLLRLVRRTVFESDSLNYLSAHPCKANDR